MTADAAEERASTAVEHALLRVRLAVLQAMELGADRTDIEKQITEAGRVLARQHVRP